MLRCLWADGQIIVVTKEILWTVYTTALEYLHGRTIHCMMAIGSMENNLVLAFTRMEMACVGMLGNGKTASSTGRASSSSPMA